MPGPTPKRSAERRRRNAVPGETIVRRTAVVVVPALPKKGSENDVHPIARRWYNSLRQSGQSEFFEPSDWAAALYVCEAMTKNLAGRFSAQLFAVVWAAMESLLTTEQARRKARLEVERGFQEEAAGPTAIDKYRERLAK